MWTSVILIASDLAWSLLLSSNNRISSFHLIRGSKLGFLTSFSYLNCYFLILVFSRSCYLLVSLRLSRLHGNPTSHPNFSYFWDSEILPHTCAPIFLAHITQFLEGTLGEIYSLLNFGFQMTTRRIFIFLYHTYIFSCIIIHTRHLSSDCLPSQKVVSCKLYTGNVFWKCVCHTQ